MPQINRYCSFCSNNKGHGEAYTKKTIINSKNLYSQLYGKETGDKCKIKEDNENGIVCQLLSELTDLKNEKMKLENEKEVIKTEYECFQMKHTNYLTINERENNDLKETIEKLRREFKLLESEKNNLTSSYLEEQSKYLKQIGELRNKLMNTSTEKDRRIQELAKANLEVETKHKNCIIKITDMQKTVEMLKSKTITYKNKLKIATQYINQLINELESSIIVKKDCEVQTSNSMFHIEENHKLASSIVCDTYVDESENILLSELFFNTTPLQDDLDLLIKNQSDEFVMDCLTTSATNG